MATTATATGIILVAGAATFGNEWYQTGTVNWKIPIATLFGAALMDGLSVIDRSAAIGFSGLVLLGALVTQFNGKSVVQSLTDITNQKQKTNRRVMMT